MTTSVPAVLAPAALAPGGAGIHAGIAVATLAAAVALWPGTTPPFPLDDAYITLHNARSLLAGQDASYGGSPLSGATSLVHLALVAAFALVLPLVAAGHAAMMVGIGAYLHGVAALALRCGLSPTLTLGVVGLGIATGFASYHLVNGLETGLAMAAVTWAVVLALDARPRVGLAVLCGVMPFVRPELAALSAALLARQAWLRWQQGDAAAILRDAAVACAVAAPWLLWSLAETGSVLPGTLAAKRAFFAHDPLSWPDLAAALALPLAKALGPLALAFVLMPRDSLAWALAGFAAALLAAFALTNVVGLTHNHARYLQPLLPLGLLGLCRLHGPSPGRSFTILLAAGVAAAAGALPFGVQAVQAGREVSVRNSMALAEWTRAHLPRGARVLIHDAGFIAFATDLRLVDLVGLKTPDSLGDHQRWTLPSRGRDRHRAVDAIATRHAATHLIVLREPHGFWASLADDLRRTGWTLTLLREPAGPYDFEVHELVPPAGAG